MEDESFYSLFLAIAGMAIFAYALSAVGRRWRRRFSEKPLKWLTSLARIATAGRWILFAVVLWFVRYSFVAGTKRHLAPWFYIVVVGIVGGIGNMLWELSSYANTEIEVRKRLSSR